MNLLNLFQKLPADDRAEFAEAIRSMPTPAPAPGPDQALLAERRALAAELKARRQAWQERDAELAKAIPAAESRVRQAQEELTRLLAERADATSAFTAQRDAGWRRLQEIQPAAIASCRARIPALIRAAGEEKREAALPWPGTELVLPIGNGAEVTARIRALQQLDDTVAYWAFEGFDDDEVEARFEAAVTALPRITPFHEFLRHQHAELKRRAKPGEPFSYYSAPPPAA